ncbi:unnamed protein product, partial [marine sediment metagenome]
MLFCTQVGPFIENCPDPSKYQTMTFSEQEGKPRFKDIYQIIKHPRRTKVFEIKTYCGYTVKVTSCHSVYVWEDGQAVLKEGNKIKCGDRLLFPSQFPRNDRDIQINLTQVLLNREEKKENISVRLKKGTVSAIPVDAWLDLSQSTWGQLQARRQSLEISRFKMAKSAGVYKTVIQQWETKADNVMPKYGKLKSYLARLGTGLNEIKYQIYLPLKRWRGEGSGNGAQIFLNNHTRRIKTKVNVDENLGYLCGWFLGDGSAACTDHNPNRFTLSMGHDNNSRYT